MPRPHPLEFRRRAVELARERAKPMSEMARDLGISDSCLRNWMVKADIEVGRRDVPNPDERRSCWSCAGSCGLPRWRTRSSRRAAAYFARENSSQNDLHLHRPALSGPAGRSVLPGDAVP